MTVVTSLNLACGSGQLSILNILSSITRVSGAEIGFLNFKWSLITPPTFFERDLSSSVNGISPPVSTFVNNSANEITATPTLFLLKKDDLNTSNLAFFRPNAVCDAFPLDDTI